MDASGSKGLGTGGSTKLALAAEISALLAFSAIRNNDRVGLLLFTDRVETFVPPRKGRQHGLRVLREILAFEPEGQGTRVAGALVILRRVVTKRAVVFLVSDFQDEGYDKVLRVVARIHDVVALVVRDPREGVLPDVGHVAAQDPETGAPVLVDSGSAKVRRAYAALAEARSARTRAVLDGKGVEWLEVSTGEPYDRPLVRFFRERARRVARAGG